MTTDGSGWLARVEGVMEAHFKQQAGPSKPGAEYKIGLKRGDEIRQIFVRAFLSPDLTDAARRDTHYQGQTVIGYVFDRLGQGWDPAEGRLPDLTILNPNPGYVHAEPKQPPKQRGLLSRLFGR